MAARERNEIAHASWGMGIGTQTGVVSRSRLRTSRKGFSYEHSPITAEDLEGVADRIDATYRLVGRTFRATLKYAAPAHSLKLCDQALRLAVSELGQAEAIGELLTITGATVESEAYFKLAQSHCLTRDPYDEAARKRAAESLSRDSLTKITRSHVPAAVICRMRLPGFRSESFSIRLPRAPWALAHEAVVTEDGPRPPGQLGAVAARCEHRRSRRPCHPRAISSGHERYPAVNHGHSEARAELGRASLTWGGGGGRTCMACKRSPAWIDPAVPGWPIDARHYA